MNTTTLEHTNTTRSWQTLPSDRSILPIDYRYLTNNNKIVKNEAWRIRYTKLKNKTDGLGEICSFPKMFASESSLRCDR